MSSRNETALGKKEKKRDDWTPINSRDARISGHSRYSISTAERTTGISGPKATRERAATPVMPTIAGSPNWWKWSVNNSRNDREASSKKNAKRGARNIGNTTGNQVRQTTACPRNWSNSKVNSN